MKERIKQLMDDLHMTQQEFADRIQIGAATLSNIFNDRTRPTLNVVELIKKNIPNVSTDWLLFGLGTMYMQPENEAPDSPEAGADILNPTIPFADYAAPTPQVQPRGGAFPHGVKPTRLDFADEITKNVDKPKRKVTEIRVYYDDQTWESFLPSKAK